MNLIKIEVDLFCDILILMIKINIAYLWTELKINETFTERFSLSLLFTNFLFFILDIIIHLFYFIGLLALINYNDIQDFFNINFIMKCTMKIEYNKLYNKLYLLLICLISICEYSSYYNQFATPFT